MPIRARLNGEDVFSFNMSESSWNTLKATYKNHSLLMPCCDSQAIPKVSKLNNYFFAHSRASSCSYAPETPEHIFLKTLIAKQAASAGWNVVTERPGETPNGEQWIADVFCTKGMHQLAFEVQWSYQTSDELKRRQNKYISSGVSATWLYRLKQNKEHYVHYSNDIPHEYETPVFGMKYRPDSKELYVPQFEVSINEFVRGMLNGKLKWSPMKGEKLTAKLIPNSRQCYVCKKTTQEILAVSVCNEAGIEIAFRNFGGDDIVKFVMRHVTNQMLASLGVGAIKSRYSEADGQYHLSEGCYHCDASLLKYSSYKASKYISIDKKPFMTFNFDYGDESLKIEGKWCFDGIPSKEFF
ncbi:competence protein CoiA family protein [Nitrosomonas sp.]|uniref:competence protein CoiA n=1 Tax=Nitrosomonas sp. TaxID=42353 RepID=UPI0026039E46|nr:competence protein CoiA family protein [Nitrosomonas sp.]MCW5602598.1 hypothetical protein [Nitrosomonas sp.]